MAESSAAWSAIADLVDVVERDDATAAREVGPLFMRAFGDELPDFPRHFVLRYVAGPLQSATDGRLDASILRQLLIALAMIGIMLARPRGLWPSPEHGKAAPTPASK